MDPGAGQVTIAAWGSTHLEQILSRGDALAVLLPQLGGIRVLERLGLADDGIFMTNPPQLALTPLLVAALVLAFAAAFRAGERLTRDTDGLV